MLNSSHVNGATIGKAGGTRWIVELLIVPKGTDGARWVDVAFRHPGTKEIILTWRPAIRDLVRIMASIGLVENLKYPGGKGRWMLHELMQYVYTLNPSPFDLLGGWASFWRPLKERFKLPQ